ncbi:hypothetical protein [Streptomyces sp. NPDC088755]|uniref:hypothetical protein n=1 Tax=Streptomyces sp. NPDC088755 TaxID=3365888 RepID=UPI00380CDE2A
MSSSRSSGLWEHAPRQAGDGGSAGLERRPRAVTLELAGLGQTKDPRATYEHMLDMVIEGLGLHRGGPS